MDYNLWIKAIESSSFLQLLEGIFQVSILRVWPEPVSPIDWERFMAKQRLKSDKLFLLKS